jgi:hypothetical protein
LVAVAAAAVNEFVLIDVMTPTFTVILPAVRVPAFTCPAVTENAKVPEVALKAEPLSVAAVITPPLDTLPAVRAPTLPATADRVAVVMDVADTTPAESCVLTVALLANSRDVVIAPATLRLPAVSKLVTSVVLAFRLPVTTLVPAVTVPTASTVADSDATLTLVAENEPAMKFAAVKLPEIVAPAADSTLVVRVPLTRMPPAVNAVALADAAVNPVALNPAIVAALAVNEGVNMLVADTAAAVTVEAVIVATVLKPSAVTKPAALMPVADTVATFSTFTFDVPMVTVVAANELAVNDATEITAASSTPVNVTFATLNDEVVNTVATLTLPELNKLVT